MAVGFNWSIGKYCEGAVAHDIPDGILPPDVENIKECMHKYTASLGVEVSGGDLAVTRWVELCASEAYCMLLCICVCVSCVRECVGVFV